MSVVQFDSGTPNHNPSFPNTKPFTPTQMPPGPLNDCADRGRVGLENPWSTQEASILNRPK